MQSGQEIEVTFVLTYTVELVLLSILVACVAACISFFINDQIKQNTLLSKTTWILLAATTLGLGIWSMHFLGMAAVELPVTMAYNELLTILTIVPAIFASFVAFYYVNQPRHTLRKAVLAGFFIGTGMIFMHYLGMYAMELEGISYSYRNGSVLFSYIFSILISISALLSYRSLFVKKGIILSKMIPALFITLAVAVVHYIGMQSMVFTIDTSQLKYHGMSESMDMTFIYICVGSSLTIIFGLLLATLLVNRVFSRRLKFFDSLTVLPNRMLFMKQIEDNLKVQAIAAIKFERMTNGTCNYGLMFDEHLLKHIATTLKSRLPGLTDMYRVSDYTFVFVAQDALAAKELEAMLTEFLSTMKNGIEFEKKHLKIPAVGIMQRVNSLKPLKELHSNLLATLEHPSISYDLSLVHYDPSYHKRNFENDLLEDLEGSLRNGEIFVVYQPKINPVTNQLVSTEALIRWIHPEHGFLAPPVFLQILEAHGRLQDLTDWIIDEVCQQLAKWKLEKPIPQVGINIPGPYLTTNRLFEKLVEATETYQIERNMIELEVTETSIVNSIEEATQAVLAFRQAGFEVALDDFGTGVSSLSYLKELAFSTLKIDKSFVDGILTSKKDAAILEAIVALGESLTMQLVIEGVEQRDQVDYLVGISDNLLIQGYYYAKPMKPRELQQWYSQF